MREKRKINKLLILKFFKITQNCLFTFNGFNCVRSSINANLSNLDNNNKLIKVIYLVWIKTELLSLLSLKTSTI